MRWQPKNSMLLIVYLCIRKLTRKYVTVALRCAKAERAIVHWEPSVRAGTCHGIDSIYVMLVVTVSDPFIIIIIIHGSGSRLLNLAILTTAN